MAQTINTNLSSLTAQRNHSKSQNDLSTAISRLSSGLRINSAKEIGRASCRERVSLVV